MLDTIKQTLQWGNGVKMEQIVRSILFTIIQLFLNSQCKYISRTFCNSAFNTHGGNSRGEGAKLCEIPTNLF